MSRIFIAAAAALAVTLAAPAVHGEQHQHGAAERSTGGPRLGDIMTLIQIRHAKLWFAGEARNWELAAFLIEELEEGFEDVAKYHPKSHDVMLGPVVEALKANEIAALEKAVEAKSRTAFAPATIASPPPATPATR